MAQSQERGNVDGALLRAGGEGGQVGEEEGLFALVVGVGFGEGFGSTVVVVVISVVVLVDDATDWEDVGYDRRCVAV